MQLDWENAEVSHEGRSVKLTELQADFMYSMEICKDEFASVDYLRRAIWGRLEPKSYHAVAMIACRTRKKLVEIGCGIHNVRGVGYTVRSNG